MATKKVGGNSRNGRDSIGRRLGIKRNHLQIVKAGTIIVRQRGMKYKLGKNVYIGKDHTIHSLVNGRVMFFTKNRETYASVVKG